MTEMQTEVMGPGVAWKGKDTWVSWCCPRLQVLFLLQVGTSPARMHNDSYIWEQNIKGIPKSWGCSVLKKKLEIRSQRILEKWMKGRGCRQFLILIKV